MAAQSSFRIQVLVGFLCALLVGFSVVLSASTNKQTIEQKEDAELSQIPKVLDYGDYVVKYNKNYSPTETLNKAKLFFGRTIKIFQHNVLFAKNKKGYFLKQNEFTDKTPKELKKNSVPSDMEPVKGADKFPDMPADLAVKMNSRPSLSDESESMASAEDSAQPSLLDNETVSPVSEERVDPVLNMMSDQEVGNPQEMINMFKSSPQLAQKMAKLLDVKRLSKGEQMTEEKLEQIRRKAKIDYSPKVKSNNKNYDPTLVASFAGTSIDPPNINKKNYARYLMAGMDFGVDIEPYPLDESANESITPRESPMSISNLFSSVSSIFNSLSSSISDEDEEKGGYIEPPLLTNDHFGGDNKNKEEKKQDDASKPLQPAKKDEVHFDVDWRKTGCITEPKNQRECDSCYAFTVAALMEYFYCRQTKKLTDFSPQYIVDCGPKTDLHGCRGGTISNVGRFIREYGLELHSMYPYTARDGECPYDKESAEKKANGYIRPTIKHWTYFNEMEAWYKYLPRSPMIVGINMPSDFHAYGGGVHDGLDCVPQMTHAMLLVGSGSENGKKFWLLKNSYSGEWGEAGYFRLSHSAPLRCFDSSFVVRVNFDGDNAKQ